MIVAFTGHRPEEIGGYGCNPTRSWIVDGLYKILNHLKPTEAICGMALGVDTWAAALCLTERIPFIAAIPFEGQESIWPEERQKHYKWLCSKAKVKYIVSKGGYSPEKMQIRNEWMVDNAHVIIAVWNGSDGGTANCVNYAKLMKKPIFILNPEQRTLTVYDPKSILLKK